MRLHPSLLLGVCAVAVLASGCSGTAGIPGGATLVPPPAPALPAAQASIRIEPAQNGYLRGDVSGLRVWGEQAWDFQIRGTGGATLTVKSSDAKKLTVVPATSGRYGRYTLQAQTVSGGSICPSCKVVQPGTVTLIVTMAKKGNGVQAVHVPVTIAHRIAAISLNPMPNPSLGGSDAVMQFYDGNWKPSVIWDDIVVHNSTSFPNVGGIAFGPDGSLYVANSGVGGYSAGTVTRYAPGSADPAPVQTYSSKDMISAAGVAVDASANVYVADNGYETLTRFPAKGAPVTYKNPWEPGADVTGVAVDTVHQRLIVAMSGEGLYNPPGAANVGRILAMPLDFGDWTNPLAQIDSTARDGVNQPYGVATDAQGRLFVVNDYVSIVQGPPGPGPEYSTLTRYDGGLSSPSARPDATASAGLTWPLSVAVDVTGSVFVANNTSPTPKNAPGKMFLVEYGGDFTSGAKGRQTIDLSTAIPPPYAPYYMNVQGIAVEPSPLR